MEAHSPKLVHGIPVGEEEELDTDSWVEPSDSGEGWDKAECGNWLCCPTLPLGKDEQAPTWDEVTRDHPQSKVTSEKEDSDRDDDTSAPAESQFEDATM